MKKKLLDTTSNWMGGITLRDPSAYEENNMALHACVNKNDVIRNRKTLAKEIGCPAEQFVFANQTHSANFHKVTKLDRGRGVLEQADAIPNCDALYTSERGVILGAFVADCVPVFLVNERASIVAVIHSGWQGTVKEIVPTLVHHLVNEENCEPTDFHVYIGPALSQDKFEVDQDVCDRFHSLGYAEDWIAYKESTNKYHIDNKQTVKTQCVRAGIPASNITVDPMCTFVSEEGFSYRQNKQAGRHLAYIALT